MSPQMHPIEQEEVMAYLDGELSAERAAGLASHLEECNECQALASSLRSVSQQLLAWEVEPSPERLRDRLTAAAGERIASREKTLREYQSNRPRWVTRGWVWALGGAVAALLLTLAPQALFVWHRVGPIEAERAASLGISAYKAAIESAPSVEGPMIVQTASLTIVAQGFDEARAAIERIASQNQGYVVQLTVGGETGAARQLKATLRVPAEHLEAALAELRKLGHIEQESRSNEDVSKQYVDLQARLKNARATEQRVLDLLRQRTGKLEDVLEAERELARIREEIEVKERQRANLEHQVRYATVQVQIREQYREQLGASPFSMGTQLWNAFAAGYRNLVGGAFGVLLFLLQYGPSVVFWSVLLVLPTYLGWRRWRLHAAKQN